MTCPYDFNHKDCKKIDAQCVDAYMELKLDELHPEELILGNSWEDSVVDLTPAVKAAETTTHLFLTPEDNPVALQYNAEHNAIDCINGDDLSRIISMVKLKDVDQTTAPVQGDVYLYDGTKFVTFNLTNALSGLTSRVTELENTVQNLETAIAGYTSKITNLENAVIRIDGVLTPPANAPNGVKVAWGNIDIFSDKNNTNSTDYGIYTHDPNVLQVNDERFA